ncbi:MAG: hypothetical protein LBK99_17755 [Opitutaceae bacterium]|jgi:hypothetical protein|nr:hypothetical protein [Opitutaceae bacterium]
MNGTEYDLRWEILRAIRNAAPDAVTLDSLHRILRAGDISLTREETVIQLAVLTRRQLVKKIPANTLGPDCFLLTGDGKATLESV